MTQGETMEELVANAREAIEGCLEVLNERELPPSDCHDKTVRVLGIAV
jgi:predicted RNase H-like HicB family nuclease